MSIQMASYDPFADWKNKIFHLFVRTPEIQLEQANRDARVSQLMHEIVTGEQALAKKALSDPLRRYPISVIGGGALNVGVMALEGASVFVHAGWIADLLIGVGLLGGLFNLREGVLAIEEGIRAWKSNDKKLAVRLLLQGVLEVALGTAVLVLSVARLLGIASITGAFAANPYILPALFFALALFLLLETSHRLAAVIKGTDLGSRLQLPELRAMLQSTDREAGIERAQDWVRSHIPECFNASQGQDRGQMRKTIEKYKAEIGFVAAMEAFLLFDLILKKKSKEEIVKQIDKLEEKIKNWNRTLYLKAFSVILAAGGFGAGMGALAMNSETIDGIQNLAMAAAGAIPLYLDIWKPFEREIPIVIYKAEDETIKAESGPSALPARGSAA